MGFPHHKTNKEAGNINLTGYIYYIQNSSLFNWGVSQLSGKDKFKDYE